MKSVLKSVSIVLFVAATLSFAASNIIADEALSSLLMYFAAAAGVIAIFCNYLIRPREGKEEKRRKKEK